jgi:hypothetical protein
LTCKTAKICEYEANCSCVGYGGNTYYICDNGYYGNPANDSEGCKKCPCLTDSGGILRCGSSAPGNNTSETSCNMSNLYTFSDDTGNYNFTEDCAYVPNSDL